MFECFPFEHKDLTIFLGPTHPRVIANREETFSTSTLEALLRIQVLHQVFSVIRLSCATTIEICTEQCL